MAGSAKGTSASPLTRSRRRRAWWLLGICVALLLVSLLVDLPGDWCRTFARLALTSNQPGRALVWLARTERVGRSNPETHLLAVRAYCRQHRLVPAREQLERARKAGATREQLDVYGDLLDAHQGDRAAAERLPRQAATSSMSPTDVLAALVRGNMYRGEFAAAEQVVEQWRNDFPEDAAAIYAAARLAELTERAREAESLYRAAWKLQSNGPAGFRLAIQLRARRQYEPAARVLEACLGSAYGDVAAIELADCLHHLGQVDQAWQWLQPALQRETTELLAQYLQVDEFVEDDRAALVASRIREAHPEETLAYLRRVLDYNPRNLEARARLAACLTRLRRREEAAQQQEAHARMVQQRKDCLQLQLELDQQPDNRALRCDLAELQMQCQSLADAQVQLQQVLEAQPHHPRAHRLMARIYRERARRSEAFVELAERHERWAEVAEARAATSSLGTSPAGAVPVPPAEPR